MTTQRATTGGYVRFVAVVCCATLAAVVVTLAYSHGAGATSPTLTISPSGTLHDGEVVKVAVGPNSVFTPYAKVNILECADPGGKAANLPTSDSTCDGNTVQGDTILVAKNGSFSESDYTVYLLPSSTLGEQANFQPVCNESNPCVFYIGQNENDFTAPKVFSEPFSIDPGSATTATTAPTTATAQPTDSSSSAPDASAVSLNSETTAAAGTLPNTGIPAQLPWILALGMVLLIGGTVGRRLTLRSQ
jgi:LPXTG-motif cell wall-anchored protein